MEGDGAELEAARPFVDHVDLFRFSLRAPSLGVETKALAADLLSEGKAAVMQRGLEVAVGTPMIK